MDSRNPEVTKKSSLSKVDFIGVLPDPDIDNTQDVVINGSSTEFSAQFADATGFEDRYVELTWNHIANTELDFAGQDPYNILPDYNDFIYVYQEFDWPYNQQPLDAEFKFNISVFRTGDFAEGAQSSNNLMFRVFVWAIDSSENWVKIYESRDAVYAEAYQMRKADLNYFSLMEIFNGMVEFNGVQEDPEDRVKLAIGLAPTWRFMSFNGTEPWTFYNGSVDVRVTFCNLYTYIEVEDDPNSIVQPEYNVTYGSTLGDVFPTHPNASRGVRDSCYGMVTGDDGSVYVTGNTNSDYDLYITEGLRFRHQFLLKYDSSLNLHWSVKNDNETQVRSMTFQNGYIYTTGYRERDVYGKNLIITKWSTAGVKLWETEWGEEYSQVGVGVAVQENGSVYVVASDYDMEGFPGYSNTSILKFDSDGLLVWERDQPWFPLLWDTRGDLYIQGEYLYFAYAYSGAILNLEGEYITGMFQSIVIPDGNDGIFTTYQNTIQDVEDSSQIVISQLNETGYPNWNATFSRQWPNGDYIRYMPVCLAMTPINTLLVLAYSYSLNFEFLILTYDLEGNLLNNETLLTDVVTKMTGGNYFMVAGNNGLGYFACDIIISQYSTDINIQAFQVYEPQGWFSLTIPMVIMIASAVVIIGAIAGIARWKRRNT